MIPNLVTSRLGFDAESSINDINIDIDRSDYQDNEAAATQVGSHNDDDANDAVADGIRNGTDAVSQSPSWSDFCSMEGGGRSIIDDPISVFYDDDDDEVEQQSFIMHQLRRTILFIDIVDKNYKRTLGYFGQRRRNKRILGGDVIIFTFLRPWER